MSDLIERIKQRIEKEQKFDEEMWNTLASKDNCQDIAIHETRNALYDVIYRVIDEESAKEPQECEWNYDGDGYYLHGNDWISGKSDFKYCPYCGRKIKVVE